MFRKGYKDEALSDISEDSFGISKYINGLGQFITECSTPITISIQGDWGSGKTSMMQLLKNFISDKVFTIWFNTWQFSQFQMNENLAISMISSLVSELTEDKLKVQEMIGNIGKKLAVMAADKVGGSAAATLVQEGLYSLNEGTANAIKNLKNKFQNAIDDKLSKENKDRVVIFIDDLDRLQPEKAVELLEVMKIFMDCKNCVYVLAIDYEIVTQGIKQKFGETIGAQKGKSFFDKMIQLPFKMPVSQYTINKFVGEMLEKTNTNVDEEMIEKYVNLIESSIGCNPRSMKRLFNTFLLLDIIVREVIVDMEPMIRQKLLFGVICMQMHFDNLYNYFARLERNSHSIEKLKILANYESLNDDMELKEKLKLNTEDKIENIAEFVKNLIKVIDSDDDNEITTHEIDNFFEIISFSKVTSIGNTEVAEVKRGTFEANPDKLEKLFEWIEDEIWELFKIIYDRIKVDFGSSMYFEYKLRSRAIDVYLVDKNDDEQFFNMGLLICNKSSIRVISRIYGVNDEDLIKYANEYTDVCANKCKFSHEDYNRYQISGVKKESDFMSLYPILKKSIDHMIKNFDSIYNELE
ncbi:KAP family P-loop NTPase fold protein [Fusobacterium sp. PH5-44]|uniref:KAP family P-loop NTPase fold protein n=1 Tax=unclassified Fusobacterium TaxID=2648384 RepID=UPI003D191C10